MSEPTKEALTYIDCALDEACDRAEDDALSHSPGTSESGKRRGEIITKARTELTSLREELRAAREANALRLIILGDGKISVASCVIGEPPNQIQGISFRPLQKAEKVGELLTPEKVFLVGTVIVLKNREAAEVMATIASQALDAFI